VTGPIQTTTEGRLDLANSLFVPAYLIANGGNYVSPRIPWQYTLNASVFYEFSNYKITLSVYNLTDQRNWQPSPSIYGNDFLVQNDPRTFEVRLQAKF
jgi:outer membrane receptor protein involved in Fe transport